jgi:RND family efflux transporter MFP subunit
MRPPVEHRGGGRRLLGIAVILVLLAAVGFGVYQHYLQHREVMAAVAERQDFVPTVRVEEVEARSPVMSVRLPGTTEAFATASIYARASGYIEKRFVDIGDHVKSGQLLAIITAPELDHQIAQAEANIAQAQASKRQTEANRDLARVTSARSTKLVADGWVTQQQADQDRLGLQAQQQATGAAAATIESQKAQLQVLRQQKTYQQVIAPFDGVVTRRNIDIGTLVQADASSGTSLFTLMQSNVIRIQLYVPQDEAIGVVPGIDAVVSLRELPGQSFPGKVTRIADALQPDTRTLLTEIDVQNPTGILAPGMYCMVELQIPRKTPALLVPADAIIFNQSGLHVAVVQDGKAVIRPITVLRDFGTEVEVSNGVKDGDKVIVTPPVDLENGRKVKVRPEPVSP